MTGATWLDLIRRDVAGGFLHRGASIVAQAAYQCAVLEVALPIDQLSLHVRLLLSNCGLGR